MGYKCHWQAPNVDMSLWCQSDMENLPNFKFHHIALVIMDELYFENIKIVNVIVYYILLNYWILL